MLPISIFSTNISVNFNTKKIIYLLSIIILISNLLVLFFNQEVQASYSSKFKDYPGYEELIKKLQTAHPNWEFEILETGLDWSEAIIAESTGRHGINVVYKTKSGAWKCSCGKVVDVNWRCASTATVAYYMDSRNSLNEDYIFQFEQLAYDSNQTADGVKKILADCNYMQGNITYFDTKGNKQTINKTYVTAIMEAAKKYNVSPYHLASRIRQEQGVRKCRSYDIWNMVRGKWCI